MLPNVGEEQRYQQLATPIGQPQHPKARGEIAMGIAATGLPQAEVISEANVV